MVMRDERSVQKKKLELKGKIYFTNFIVLKL